MRRSINREVRDFCLAPRVLFKVLRKRDIYIRRKARPRHPGPKGRLARLYLVCSLKQFATLLSLFTQPNAAEKSAPSNNTSQRESIPNATHIRNEIFLLIKADAFAKNIHAAAAVALRCETRTSTRECTGTPLWIWRAVGDGGRSSRSPHP